MSGKAIEKEKIVRLLSTYTQRRTKYLKNAKNCSAKIKTLKRSLKRSMKGEYAKQEEIAKLGIKYMEQFNGLILKNIHDDSNRLIKNSISCIVKWTLENKGSSKYLADYFGYYDSSQLYKIRLKFNKTFSKTPENKVLYHRFLNYINENNNENSNSTS